MATGRFTRKNLPKTSAAKKASYKKADSKSKTRKVPTTSSAKKAQEAKIDKKYGKTTEERKIKKQVKNAAAKDSNPDRGKGAGSTGGPRRSSAKPSTKRAAPSGTGSPRRGSVKPASKKAAEKKTSTSTSKFGSSSSKTVTHKGKKMANVTAEQLKKTGLSLRAYMNKWNKSGKRPS